MIVMSKFHRTLDRRFIVHKPSSLDAVHLIVDLPHVSAIAVAGNAHNGERWLEVWEQGIDGLDLDCGTDFGHTAVGNNEVDLFRLSQQDLHNLLSDFRFGVQAVNLVRLALPWSVMYAPPPIPPEEGGVYIHLIFFADATAEALNPKP